jgi:hypothetical protein
MKQKFDNHGEFFDSMGETALTPTYYGEEARSFSIEEMYQHFKARLQEETAAPSLRDHFAAHVVIEPDLGTSMARALTGRNMPDYSTDPIANMEYWAEVHARLRYMEADAMLAAREAK